MPSRMDRGTGRSRGYARAAAGAMTLLLCAGMTVAQDATTTTPSVSPPKAASRPVNPHKENLRKMMRPITIDFTGQRLEDVIVFLQEFTDADFEPEWRGDRADGLDKDQLITLNVKGMTALEVLERVLAKSQTAYDENTWQMTPAGTIQFGPKSVLNRERRLVMYDINDLLTVLPRYADVPTIDLEQVLNNEGGGGSIFEDEDGDAEPQPSKQERAQQVLDLIVTIVEPEQWVDNGGDGGTIRYYNGTLIVNAPDYMHRQINGYPYWPQYSVATGEKGRRWVSLNSDNAISKVDGFASDPAVAPRP